MKRITSLIKLLLIISISNTTFAQSTIKVFDKVTFFDGYAAVVTSPEAPAGTIRFRNDLYARKLSTEDLASIGTTLDLNVTIGALCDNYDRIGSVNLALVPKGSDTYVYNSVQHIEIARFITPFMNKNRQPTEVPYQWKINNVASLLKEKSLTDTYDIWVELQVFGVPYAANTEVAGCAGRNDVFEGTLELITDLPAEIQNDNLLIPISFLSNFSNYNPSATDTLGKTTRTFQINLPNDVKDASIFLITSNHGANSGGEEYNRRVHYVYFDGELKIQYKPGRSSCEPFRKYNTQANGIYGSAPKTNAQWQAFSNWCPGDIIDTRKVELGDLAAGNHTFTIRVPTAVFTGGQGNIPLSLYLQSKQSGSIGVSNLSERANLFNIFPSPAKDIITIKNLLHTTVQSIDIINMVGNKVFHSGSEKFENKTIQLSTLKEGFYIIRIHTAEGSSIHKLQILH